MSSEVDGACPSRLPCVSSSELQVDSLENNRYHHEFAAPAGDLERGTAAPSLGSVPLGNKLSPGTCGGASSSSSSLHRVADKLKEKLSRQMESSEDGVSLNAELLPLPSTLKSAKEVNQAQKTSETRSQYHSILKLSSPSSKSYGVSSNFPAQNQHFDFATGGRFYSHPAADIYPPSVADTLDMLRGMMKGPEGVMQGRKDEDFSRQTGGSQLLNYCEYEDHMMFANGKYAFSNNSDDDESIQSDPMAESISADEFSDQELNKRPAYRSRSSSISSERRMEHKEKEEDDEEPTLGNNGADDSVCSDGSLDEKIEAKKARVENIISNMRLSPNSKLGSGCGGVGGGHLATISEVPSTTSCDVLDRQNGVVPVAIGYGQLPETRRPKRKQYIPQQHEAREDELDEPAVKLRKVEKDMIQQELHQMHEQLAEMQQKCLQLLDQDQTNELAERADDHRNSRVSLGLVSDLNRNEIQKLSSGLLKTIQADGKDLIEKAGKQFDDLQPSNSNKMSSLKNLAKLLKAEITSSVGTLVDSIVKNFMAKHIDLQKEAPKESQLPKSPKINAFEPPRENTVFKQPPREEVFLAVGKPLEAPPLAIVRPPCLPPTLLPPHLPLPVHTTFAEQNGLRESVKQQQHRELTEKYIRPYFDLHGKTAFEIPQAHLPLFAPHAFYPPPMAKFQPLFVKEPEQTEALPLVVSTPKKKRTKVTDTRLSPRAARAMLQESLGQHQHHHQQPDHHIHQPQHQQPHRVADSVRKPFSHHHHYPSMGGLHEAFPHPSMLPPIGLPTSVAIHNPSLQHSDLLQAMYSQPGLGHRDSQGGGQLPGPKRPSSNSSDMANTPNSLLKCDSDAYDQMMSDSLMSYDGHSLTSTLTPMHLRKAKLMFFYVRYPSSAILKIYFPDVKFNKNNTAQLVKWFSNFREFYYIQMEKYARQALAEGVKNVTDLVITTDSELYRVLVLHYNRNNQIEVPENFRFVVQATLREFFISIAAEKDQEQSWKKSIYKIIARMDDAVPEYFKSPNWMEQLADG